MAFLKEFCAFLKVRKKLWLVPMLVLMFAFGVLLFVTESSGIAPFIYTLF